MELSIILLACLSFILCIFYFVTKIIDWISLKRRERFENKKSEFVYDLYRLKMKWSKKGEHDFCKGIDILMDSTSGEPEALTDYGKSISKTLR